MKKTSDPALAALQLYKYNSVWLALPWHTNQQGVFNPFVPSCLFKIIILTTSLSGDTNSAGVYDSELTNG